MGELDAASLLFCFPDDIVISSVRATTTEVVLHIACRRRNAACPLCQQPSERVHGQYGRTVADLPCAGRRVVLALTVRKFVCTTPTCPRQIFTERLPDLVQSYARMTNRLRDALVALGLATSAQVSERVGPRSGCAFRLPLCFAVCVRSPAHPHYSYAFLVWMIGHGKRARPTARCL